MGVKLSKLMMRQHKDGVYRMSRDTVAKHVAQIEEENAALKRENELMECRIDEALHSIEHARNALLTAEESE